MSVHSLQDIERDARLVSAATALNQVPGFLDISEGVVLMSLAASPGGSPAIVEVGSFKGKSTSFLAAGCRFAGRGHVYAVDHFLGSPEHQKGAHEETPEIVEAGTTLPVFRANLARFGLDAHVTEMIGSSAEIAQNWNQPIRLLFIDGDHSYASTKADFDAWYPFVEHGGIVCMHDYRNPCYLDGVTKFIDEVMLPSPELEHLSYMHFLMVFRKK
jgi:predicted O-methyltransferase YrrM